MAAGGRRPGAGRPRGVKNKAKKGEKLTLERLAREHTASALKALVDIVTNGESEGARIAAATALLDRGYGRPRQSVEMTGKDGGPIEHADVRDRLDRTLEGIAANMTNGAGNGRDSEAGETVH